MTVRNYIVTVTFDDGKMYMCDVNAPSRDHAIFYAGVSAIGHQDRTIAKFQVSNVTRKSRTEGKRR